MTVASPTTKFTKTINNTLHEINVFCALSIWVFGLLAVFFWFVLTLILFPVAPLYSSISFSVYILFLLAPLEIKPPHFIRRFLTFSLQSAFDYFPVTVLYEDKDALQQARPHILAFEPHSVLPQGMCAFGMYSPDTPPLGMSQVRILVSSTGFWVPIMRHLWWFLGCRPASRSTAKALLAKGRTVAICPGGVMECLYMTPTAEAIYLKKRLGFVRLALETGCPLVPVFAFGQSDLYGYIRPFFDWPKGIIPRAIWMNAARKIGFAPMLVWGWFGTPMPRRVNMTIVVGKPLYISDKNAQLQNGVNECDETMAVDGNRVLSSMSMKRKGHTDAKNTDSVTQDSVQHAKTSHKYSDEVVEAHLQDFIREMERLHEKYSEKYNTTGRKLIVY